MFDPFIYSLEWMHASCRSIAHCRCLIDERGAMLLRVCARIRDAGRAERFRCLGCRAARGVGLMGRQEESLDWMSGSTPLNVKTWRVNHIDFCKECSRSFPINVMALLIHGHERVCVCMCEFLLYVSCLCSSFTTCVWCQDKWDATSLTVCVIMKTILKACGFESKAPISFAERLFQTANLFFSPHCSSICWVLTAFFFLLFYSLSSLSEPVKKPKTFRLFSLFFFFCTFLFPYWLNKPANWVSPSVFPSRGHRLRGRCAGADPQPGGAPFCSWAGLRRGPRLPDFCSHTGAEGRCPLLPLIHS